MSRNQQETPTRIPGRGITLRETDLFESWLVALEGEEFAQITDGRMFGDVRGVPFPIEACVYGVGSIVIARADLRWGDMHRDIGRIVDRAGAMLGYSSLMDANDAGCSFKVLAPALRAARLEVERGCV